MSTSRIVDGCSNDSSIAQIFAQKYRSLYTVPYNVNEMESIVDELEVRFSDDSVLNSDHIVHSRDVSDAIQCLHRYKRDGNSGLSTDNFLHAGPELSIHIAFLFTCMISHGSAPKQFGASTIIPIPKNHHINGSDSDNFRGIALSSVFCKLFDNIVLARFHDKLNTSDLQFGFKAKSSTNSCTMVLKETISYYVKNQSSVFCSFFRRK